MLHFCGQVVSVSYLLAISLRFFLGVFITSEILDGLLCTCTCTLFDKKARNMPNMQEDVPAGCKAAQVFHYFNILKRSKSILLRRMVAYIIGTWSYIKDCVVAAYDLWCRAGLTAIGQSYGSHESQQKWGLYRGMRATLYLVWRAEPTLKMREPIL